MCVSEEATLELIDEFNSRLEAAGLTDVLAGNQEQIDAYLAGQSGSGADAGTADSAADTADSAE